jgi:hypothetical protein
MKARKNRANLPPAHKNSLWKCPLVEGDLVIVSTSSNVNREIEAKNGTMGLVLKSHPTNHHFEKHYDVQWFDGVVEKMCHRWDLKLVEGKAT